MKTDSSILEKTIPQKLPEPSMLCAFLLFFPLGVLLAVCFLYLWFVFIPVTLSPTLIDAPYARTVMLFFGLVIAFLARESLQRKILGSSIRQKGSPRTNPTAFLIGMQGEVTRNRMILAILTPTIAFGILPMLGSILLRRSTNYNYNEVYIIIAYISTCSMIWTFFEAWTIVNLLAHVPCSSTLSIQESGIYWTQPKNAQGLTTPKS